MAARALIRRVALALLAIVASACVNPGGGAPSQTFTFGSTTPTATPGPIASTAAPTPSPSPTPSPRIGAAVMQEARVIVTGLEVPWAIELAPDGRLFVTERPGRVRIVRFDGTRATLDAQPWATVGVRAGTNNEGGLLGLALDPKFAQNGFVYLYYSYRSGNATLNKLVRMRDSGGVGVEETVLVDGIAGSTNHDGGRVKFGPDGKLYVTTGDAEVDTRAQQTTNLNGKVLRVNADGSIPADNPFPTSAIWSYGHRNVQGIAWHPDTGALYETEHGPSGLFPFCCNDEVNLIEKGKNYGWPTVIGQPHDARFVDPLLTSGRNDTWAPSGATFLTHVGPLRGSFLFATLRGTHLHRVVFGPDGTTVAFEERLLVNQFGRLRDVYELPSGQLLLLTSNRDDRGRAVAGDDRIVLVTLG